MPMTLPRSLIDTSVSMAFKVVLQQDFSYSTTWGGVNWDFWTPKQTTVTAHDLVRGTTFQTIIIFSSHCLWWTKHKW